MNQPLTKCTFGALVCVAVAAHVLADEAALTQQDQAQPNVARLEAAVAAQEQQLDQLQAQLAAVRSQAADAARVDIMR